MWWRSRYDCRPRGSSERGSAPGTGSDVLRISSPSTAGASLPFTGHGATTFGLGSVSASQLLSVPTWTTTPAYGGAPPAPASWPTSRMRTAIAAYGGYALQDMATPKDPKSDVSSAPAQPPVGNTPTPATGTAAASYRYSGMPSHIKNAVRMIQPFYSENSTVDKARAFWDAFERATVGLDESLRLSAFRECLKGKPGEEWWMYSKIENFETLRVRFHNQFICLTPLQMIERLKNTKRSRGMSAEVWGDLIQGLCDEAQCFDPRMRYQYFLSGLRNREWKTALSTAMVNSIPQAVAVLLYKNMHIPVEDDADFADMVANTSKSAGAESALLTQMMQMLQANQNLILQQQRELAQSPRSPRRSNYAAAAFGNAAPPTQAPSYPQGTPTSGGEESVAPPSRPWDDTGGYVARVSLEADDEDWNVPVNEEEAEASHTFDYNEETVVNNYDNEEMWNRDDAASAVRYEEGLTTMETTAEELTTMETTDGERPVTVGYATTTEECQPNESAMGVLANEEVALDLKNDETANEEPSERASGMLETGEVAYDLEEPYLRTEKPSERAIGALTSAEKTTVNVCNGARCRCLEALPVVVERVNFLPSKQAEGNASVAPAEKKTDNKESDSPAEEIGVSFPVTPEYDRNADPSGLERVSEASEDGLEEVESTEKSSGVLDEQAAITEAAPPPGEPPPPHTRLFTEEALGTLEAKTPSPMSVELEEYDKELEERLFPLDEVELRERVVKNATKAKELSLEELSVMLNLPLETLERARVASPGELSTPEYWLDWYRKTLAASAEAKRANRDFRASVPPTKEGARAESGPSRPTKPESADDDVASVIDEVVASVVSSGRVATTMVDESRVIANICVPRAGSERKDEGAAPALPFRLRTLVRSVVFLLILDAEAKNGERCPKCHYPKAYPPETEPRGHFVPGPFSADHAIRARELVVERAGVLGDSVMRSVLREVSRTYLESVGTTISKRLERRKTCWCDRPVQPPPLPRRVRFDCSSLATERSEALGSHSGCVEDPDDVLNYVCFVKDGSAAKEKRKPGLKERKDRPKPKVDPNNDVEDPIPEGKRVICSVEGYEATSVGFIDSLPAELLINTGAIASLVDSRLRTFAVVDRLHVHALLGTDALKAFRAVIDMEENVMMLKETGETIRLGTPRVEEMYVSRTNSTVRLCPGGQALVVANLMGTTPENSTVLIEGLPELDPLLKIARSLCSIQNGQTIVEVCNASEEDLVIQKGTALAAATIVPKSAFLPTQQAYQSGSGTRGVDSVISSAAKESNPSREKMPGLKEAYRAEMEADFTDSKLGGEQQELLRSLLGDFRDMFVESSLKPGRTDLLKFSIDTGTHPPIKQRPYRVSNAEGDVMEAEIDQYLELGLVRPSTSPWASPVLMIRKPDGGIRFCIDYRRLNAVTIKDCYPMPLIDDILDVLKGAKLYSTMDIASGYWNVPMDPDSVEKTAFTCKYGLFEWLVMPFGLCNAVPAFERLMENVLVDLKWRTCLVYLDDCVVFSSDFPTHLVRLRQVLERFRNAGFRLKMKKCRWGRDQVAFLGHIVTPTGILPNPEKVKAVMNVARPHDLHTVRAFLGLTSYFRRYIPGYAAISAPIERLKMKGTEFVWNADCEAAFLQLKRRLVEPPILVYPDFSQRFKLYVDSSRLAVGACLMQTVDGRERVIAYASKILVGSEKNWIYKTDGTSEIECWGIVWATRKFRCYLDRTEFDLYTYHKALTWVFNENNRTTNAKLARWAMELSQLRFNVYHKPGTAMGHADGLSRLHTDTVCALTIADLLNDVSSPPGEGPFPVGEGSTTGPNDEDMMASSPVTDGALDEAVRAAMDALDEVGERSASPPPVNPRTDAVDDAPGDFADTDDDELQDAVGQTASSSVDHFGLDWERFQEEQKRSPWIQALLAFLEDGALALDAQLRVKELLMAPHYVVKNSMLMRRVHLKARGGPACSLSVPVIPLPFIETVLHYCHSDVFAAHVGQSKTMEKVRKHAYWHGWKKDVIDGGPLVTTPRGHKYILVFADYFTRWVEAFPVEALDTPTFVRVMVDEVLCRHGVPERLLSDRGTNFISELAKSFYETLGIKKLFGAAYHPQTQGLVERFNGTLIGMLRMFVSEAQSDWDLYLPRVLFAYRTSYHDSLGDTPFFSLYGRDPVLPLDLAFLNTKNDWKSNEVAEYRRKLYLSMRDTRRLVERQLLKAQDRNARRRSDQVAVEFNEGDAVWVYQYFRARRGEKKTKKLAFSWHGPYRVVGRLGENTYKIAIPNHPDRVVSVNVNRLKKFAGRWSRPFPNEVPAGVERQPDADDAGPLTVDDLPTTSFVERLTLGGEETVFSGVTSPIVEVLAKRVKGRQEQYLVLTASYETCWRPTSSLLPDHAPLIKIYEVERRTAGGWPELRRSARLVDANVTVDEDELLF
ncbi:unnamed protein product [Phytophthora fragariaefolia]|uniref:Unnamed protein product n=1 Tax=Phytophthora fragariaefolia TaxID=1490495 RepID=A0A9W6U9G9_9STRA|nr:unnamed protein product [Phytophthora fragariaefolia]